MLANQGQAAASVTVIDTVSAANTAAATSAWLDVRGYEGDLVFIQHLGAVTGSLTGTFEDATSVAGAGAASIVPNEGDFTAVSSANDIQVRTINARATRGWIQYTGTIATGPVLTAVSYLAHPKYTT